MSHIESRVYEHVLRDLEVIFGSLHQLWKLFR